MTAETCIPSNDYCCRLVLADGTAYKPLAECIEAGNEAAGSLGPYGPAREIRAFCWCAMHPSSGKCVQQFLAPNVTEGAIRSRQRQPKCTSGSRNDGGGNDGDDGGGGPPCDVCGQPVCLTPRFCNLCRLSDAGRLFFLFRGRR